LDASILEKIESKITAKRVVRKEPRGIPLEKARVVVCGGYGVGNSENRKQIEKLATLLGGAAGCTRPALDQGRPEDDRNMIGTSGKTVRPDVYIGVGVSGAAHHVCGMKDAGVILNINTDEDAEIFKVSDYKITRDGAEIVEALCDLMESDARFYADEHLNFP
jgi:electron transfer flavoprotein alpha subunit